MKSIFLSHCSEDKSLARRIARDLQRAGIAVWLDEWEILVGQSISQKIEHGLRTSDLIALLLTRSSIESGWVEKEWRAKLWDEVRSGEVTILPLRADDCEMPYLLRDRRYADFRADYKEALDDLLRAIKSMETTECHHGEIESNDHKLAQLEELLAQKERRKEHLKKKVEDAAPENGVVVFRDFDDDALATERELDELLDEIHHLGMRVEIRRAERKKDTKSSQDAPEDLRYISEGGRRAIFFSVINSSARDSWLLSSFSVEVHHQMSMASGAENRINLAELVSDLDGVRRNVIAMNISSGETLVLDKKVVRLDPGDIIPFSIPLCGDWQCVNAVVRVRLNFIGQVGVKSLFSDCLYSLEKPHSYSTNLLVAGVHSVKHYARGEDK